MQRFGFILVLITFAGFTAHCAADDAEDYAILKDWLAYTGQNTYSAHYQIGFEIDLGDKTNDLHLKGLGKFAPKQLWKINLATTGKITGKGWECGITKEGIKELAALPGLSWLRVHPTFGNDDLKELIACKKLETLILFWSKVDDKGLVHLASMPKLREIDLTRAAVTDACFEPLSKVSTLESISLFDTRITGKGISQLSVLPKLTDLNLLSSDVKSTALEEIGKLKSLRKLNLTRVPVTDDGLKALAGLTELRELKLGESRVTDAGVQHLAGLKNLTLVYLDGPDISDESAKILAKLTNLRTVWLTNTKVTDQGLKELVVLKDIQQLHVGRTKVTPEGVAAFKKILPNCTVFAR